MSDVQMEILNIMEKGSQRGKARMTVKDISKKIGISQMKIKKDIRVLIESEKIAYWSGGCTNYVMLQKDIIQLRENENTN